MSFWVTILEAWVPQLEIFHQILRGCLHDKIALAQVSYRDDFLILYYVYMMMGHFISQLFDCTLHVGKIHVWMNSETLCMCYPFQSTCRPIWHRNRWSFHVYMMSLWNFYLTPVQQPEWTHFRVTRNGMAFCDGVMYTNVEPWRGTRVNSGRRESRPGVM